MVYLIDSAYPHQEEITIVCVRVCVWDLADDTPEKSVTGSGFDFWEKALLTY